MTNELFKLADAYNAPFKSSVIINNKTGFLIDKKSKMIRWPHVLLLRDLLLMYKDQLNTNNLGEMKTSKPLVTTLLAFSIKYKIKLTTETLRRQAQRLKEAGFIDYKYNHPLKCNEFFFSQQVINVVQKPIKK